MRVKKSVSKNTINYAIIKDIKVGNKRTSTIVENLGNHETLQLLHPEMEPMEWAKLRAKELTELDKEDKQEIENYKQYKKAYEIFEKNDNLNLTYLSIPICRSVKWIRGIKRIRPWSI